MKLALVTLVGACIAMPRAVNAQAVFAHFMVQNSYSYTQSDWSKDMSDAQAIGIDGFALNIALNDYEVDRINDAYAAAKALGFKLFYSFDMSYNWQESDMVSLVVKYATSTSTFLWNNNVLVSTYSGESKGDAWWSNFKNTLQQQGINVVLAPAFTTYRDPSQTTSLLSTFPSIDGFFNWWSWPADTDTLLTTDTDLAYQKAISSRNGPYIMSVSPWQFKNIDGGGDWVELSDTLWNYRWQQAVKDVKPDIVEIVTWNDYGESHYIGDINPNVDLGTQASLYVRGFDHAQWRAIAQYYIQYFKTGSAPTVTQKDQVVFWYRVYPKGITCSMGSLPRNAAYPADAIFALALLTDTATISLDVGSSHAEFGAGPGVTMGSVPFPVEDAQVPYIQIIRNGSKIADGYGSKSIEQAGCNYYNFNPSENRFEGVRGRSSDIFSS